MNRDETNFAQNFFDRVKPIKMTDPLASTLGAVSENAPIYYHYSEVVKYAGHSCPAVSGAFMITKLALEKLYKEETPVRGEIKVRFKGDEELNANGPISQVITFITGAAGSTGFKGLGGKFSRFNLLSFNADNLPEKGVSADVEFERADTAEKVRVVYKPGLIPTDPKMGELMKLTLSGKATHEEKTRFGNLWQKRVETVLTDPPEGTFTVTSA